MSLAGNALGVVIRLDHTTKGMSKSDISKMVQSHFLIQQARDDFLAGDMAWWEYLELVEMHNVNMDSYLNTVEDNLHDIGIIV